MLKTWKSHFRLSQFSLAHHDPGVFVKSQWQQKDDPNIYYLIYRLSIAVYLFICWILSMVDPSHPGREAVFYVKWLIYLTNWGFTLCTLQSVIALIMLISYFYSHYRKSKHHLHWKLYKFYWALHTMAIDFAFAITILYWTLVFRADKMPVDFLNVMVHGVNSAVMFLDLLLVSHPVVLWHFYLSVGGAVTYVFFTYFYYLAGGTSRNNEPNIYAVINWSKPLPTFLVVLGAVLGVLVIHVFAFLLCRCRTTLAEKSRSDNEDVSVRDRVPVQELSGGVDNKAYDVEAV